MNGFFRSAEHSRRAWFQRAGWGIGFAALLAGGCAKSPRDPSAVQAHELCSAKREVEGLRDTRRRTAKQTVKLTLRAPIMPQALSARGAVAFSEGRDLRMILLGPGGGTALDLWMHDRAFRFSVPAIGRTVRGDERTPPQLKRGLPVDFLRWWILDPLGGEIIFAKRSALGLEMVLRDRNRDGSAAYVDATIRDDHSVEAVRTSWSSDGSKLDEEHVHASSLACGRVDYHQASTDLTVEAVCEEQSSSVNARAFIDPDLPEGRP